MNTISARFKTLLKARKKQLQKFQENYEPEKNSATVMIKEIDSN